MSDNITKLEKTLAGLDFATHFFEARANMATPGSDGQALLLGSMKACTDAAEMLKAQEPVEPIKRENHNGFTYYHCAKCDTVLVVFRPKYCHKCGKAVKWE